MATITVISEIWIYGFILDFSEILEWNGIPMEWKILMSAAVLTTI